MLERLRQLARTLKARLDGYRALAADPRVPRVSRWLLGAAIAYVLLPFDLVPDWIPILGHLDDLVIVPLLLWLAIRKVPAEVMAEHLPEQSA